MRFSLLILIFVVFINFVVSDDKYNVTSAINEGSNGSVILNRTDATNGTVDHTSSQENVIFYNKVPGLGLLSNQNYWLNKESGQWGVGNQDARWNQIGARKEGGQWIADGNEQQRTKDTGDGFIRKWSWNRNSDLDKTWRAKGNSWGDERLNGQGELNGQFNVGQHDYGNSGSQFEEPFEIHINKNERHMDKSKIFPTEHFSYKEEYNGPPQQLKPFI